MTLTSRASRIGDVSVFETRQRDVDGARSRVEMLRPITGSSAQRTGLGVEPNEEACARFPYEPHDVPLFDGSINMGGVASGAVVMNGDL